MVLLDSRTHSYSDVVLAVAFVQIVAAVEGAVLVAVSAGAFDFFDFVVNLNWHCLD